MGTPVFKDGDIEKAPLTLGVMARNHGPVSAIIAIAVAGGMAYANFNSRLASVELRISTIESRGTEAARDAQSRVAALERVVDDRGRQSTTDHDLLVRMDRRLALFICRADAKHCNDSNP